MRKANFVRYVCDRNREAVNLSLISRRYGWIWTFCRLRWLFCTFLSQFHWCRIFKTLCRIVTTKRTVFWVDV